MGESWALPAPDDAFGSFVTDAFRAGGLDYPQATVLTSALEIRANLLRTGRYLTYPQGQRCISDFYVSLANLFDVPLTTFGDPSVCKGPLPGLA